MCTHLHTYTFAESIHKQINMSSRSLLCTLFSSDSVLFIHLMYFLLFTLPVPFPHENHSELQKLFFVNQKTSTKTHARTREYTPTPSASYVWWWNEMKEQEGRTASCLHLSSGVHSLAAQAADYQTHSHYRIHPSIHLYIHPSIYPFIHLSIFCSCNSQFLLNSVRNHLSDMFVCTFDFTILQMTVFRLLCTQSLHPKCLN